MLFPVPKTLCDRSAAGRAGRPAGGPAGRPPRARRRDACASARRRFGRIFGSRTHHTRDLRPAAICCTRAAFTEAPVIILRAPKETAEVDAAGATAARAVTRVRRMATGAFATMGAEMVIAAIVSVRVCGTKSGRQTTDRPLFGPRNAGSRCEPAFHPETRGAAMELKRRVLWIWKKVSYGESVVEVEKPFLCRKLAILRKNTRSVVFTRV